MTVSTIPTKSFLKAMTLPDDQRRKMLEMLGAKLMLQLKAETESRQSTFRAADLATEAG